MSKAHNEYLIETLPGLIKTFLRKSKTAVRLALKSLRSLYSRLATFFFRFYPASFSALFHHHTDKMSDKWALYLKTYDVILAPWHHKKLSLLERGVQNGGSLQLWAKYFRKASAIVGCDIDPKCGALKF